jgi:hypothetical protein
MELFVTAEQEFRRAIELNPNYSDAHQMNGFYLSGDGSIRRSAQRDEACTWN